MMSRCWTKNLKIARNRVRITPLATDRIYRLLNPLRVRHKVKALGDDGGTARQTPALLTRVFDE
jgi:hypothetical protein